MSPGLEAALTAPAELSGVLAWAVAGLRDLEASGDFADPRAGVVAEIVEGSNPVVAFLEEATDATRRP